MKLQTRIALWTFVVTLALSATLTALFAGDSARARFDRLRAEGKRIALSTISLYDVLRLTGSDADRATLQSFLDAAVKGNSDEREMAWAVVLDENAKVVASAVNANVVPASGGADPSSLADAPARDAIVVDAEVVARDTSKKTADAKAGRVVVALSTNPARAALLRDVAAGGALSALVALAFAGVIVVVVGRRAVKPIASVVEAMRDVKLGKLDVVVPNETGSKDEAGELVDGFNDMVASLLDRQGLASTLDRHVGKKLANEARSGAVGRGRRVHVTALFLDVEGFSTRVIRDAPESVVAFLQELVSSCAMLVDKHDGHIQRIFGDNILALWGVPDARDDDAANAVACALALGEACRALSDARKQRGEEPFTIGIGVATGDAVLATVGTDERAENLVVGEPVTLARHIEEEAKATDFGLLVSEETFRAVSAKYEGAATPPVLLRGFGVPIALYRVRPKR